VALTERIFLRFRRARAFFVVRRRRDDAVYDGVVYDIAVASFSW